MGLLVVVVVVVVAAAAVVICVYVRYLAHQYMAEYLNPLPCVYVSGRYLAHQYMAEYLNPLPCVYVSGRYLAHQYMAECLVALDCIADGIDHLNPDLVNDVNTVYIGNEHSKSDQQGPRLTSHHIIIVIINIFF